MYILHKDIFQDNSVLKKELRNKEEYMVASDIAMATISLAKLLTF